MPDFEVKNPQYADLVAGIIARQTVMALIGARLVSVAPGAVDIVLPFRADLCQQDGFLHAGIVTTIVDTACGSAAATLMAPGMGVLTVEYKVNFMSPAVGREFIARGRVVRAGRVATVCTGEVTAVTEGGEKGVCLMQATMMAVPRE